MSGRGCQTEAAGAAALPALCVSVCVVSRAHAVITAPSSSFIRSAARCLSASVCVSVSASLLLAAAAAAAAGSVLGLGGAASRCYCCCCCCCYSRGLSHYQPLDPTTRNFLLPRPPLISASDRALSKHFTLPLIFASAPVFG